MSIEETLEAGMSAIRSGDRARAAALFARVVQADPTSERGWFMLGTCCETREQREYCFRRVLAINPNHNEARKQLVDMQKPARVESSPAWASQSPPAHTISTPQPVAAVTPPASSLVYSERDLISSGQEDLPSAAVSRPASEVKQTKVTGVPRKKSNTKLILALIFGPALIACMLGVPLYLIFGGPAPTISPPLVELPTQVLVLPGVTAPSITSVPGTAIPSPMPTVVYTPSFESAACTIDIPTGVKVECGYLVVPEDRSGDPSHTIRLAVAVYKSSSPAPAAEPVVFLQGGPGAEAVQLSADAYDVLVAPFLPKRDFIVFDQRGTGLSEPALGCEELTKTYSQDIRGLIPSTTRELVYSNAFVSCNGLMSAQGVKLNAYTTLASSADVKDLLVVLGHQKAHLYGASYGTRLAQVIMREYPEVVQSAVMDSVVPVEANLFSRYSEAIDSGLRALFISCAVEPECNAAYPNLEAVFWELVSQLDANPVTVTTSNYPTGTITETVNGSTVVSVVLGSIKYSPLISTAPQTIYRFRNGDFSTLMVAQSSMPFAFEGISPGLFISMMCHEHIFATTPEELQTAGGREGIREYAWLPFYGDPEELFRTCKSWGATGLVTGENDPLISDIPSLIISGKYDPTTPPIYAQQIAAGLSRHYYFDFPNLGHTPTTADSSGCAMRIVTSFLDNPSVEPDHSCLNELDNVDFIVPYTGTPAYALETQRVMGISVDVPRDWQTTGDGFYLRGESPLDITTIGISQTNLSASELQDWLSVEAYGYRGLDAAPVDAGQMNANGLAWNLYASTSSGRPVDIAMADYGGQSMVILMFSNFDEHDALYRTVFLPMVQSVR